MDDGDWGSAGVWLVLSLAVALGAAFLTYLFVIDDLAGNAAPAVVAAKALLGVTPAALLAAGGLWLARSALPHRHAWHAAMWTFGGLVTWTTLTGWQFYLQLVEGGVAGDPVETLLVNAQAGAVGGLLVGIYDARARVHADRLERTTDQLQFLNQLLRHNILNGVQIIQGYASALATDESLEEDDRIKAIDAQTDTIASLISNARQLERVSDEETELEPRSLASVVSTEVATATSTFSNATFDVSVPMDLRVLANDLLGPMVENLVSNAVEHNDRENPRIEVSAERVGAAVVLSVADDGPGVPDDRKEAVFEFAGEGTHGLGLYLVRTLAAEYGGEVWVEDNEPRGAVFNVALSCADATG